MSELSPYPRPKPPEISRWDWADRIASGLLAAYVLVSFGAAFLADRDPRHFIAAAIGLLPAGLLLVRRPAAMFVVSLMSLPCCLGATWYADINQIPQISDKMLWDGCLFVLAIGAYALVRCVHLTVRARKTSDQ